MEEQFEAVYADPEADGPRERLAKALSARSDPRGEFTQLQLQPRLTRQERQRERALLKAHAAEWLEPLRHALVARTVEWERGFPVSGRLAFRKAAQERDALVGLSSLATLRRLDVSGGDLVHDREWLERLLFESPLHRLRELTGVHTRLFLSFLRGERVWALRRLAFDGHGDEHELAEVAAATAACASLPELVDLQLSYCHARPGAPGHDLFYQYDPVGNYGWLWSTAFGRRLRVLRMNHGPSGVIPWIGVLDEHRDHLGLEQVVLFSSHLYTLERTDAGWTRLTGRLPRDSVRAIAELDRMLELLPDTHRLELAVDGYLEATQRR